MRQVRFLLIVCFAACAQVPTWDAYIDAAERAVANADLATARAEISAARKLLGPSVPSDPRLSIMDNLEAAVLHMLGDFRQAETLFRRAMTAMQADPRTMPVHIAIVLRNLAESQFELGKYAAAEQSLREALVICESLPAAQKPTRAGLINLLGVVYTEMHRYEEAEAILDEARSLVKARDDQTLYVAALNATARLRQAQGRMDEAEKLLLEALEIHHSIYGQNHVSTALATLHVAQFHLRLSKPERAQPLLARTQYILEKSVGPDSAHLGIALGETGLLYILQEKLTLAERTLRKSLEILEPAIGELHPRLPALLNRLAWVLAEQKKFDEAETFLRRAFTIESKEPSLMMDQAVSHQLRARIQTAKGDVEAAKASYSQALNAGEQAWGSSGAGLLPILKEYSTLLKPRERPDKRVLEQRIKTIQSSLRSR